ncbi:MAG: hypothetical protein MZV70_10885 [Desulfobacterales bacterium]|nr:hypothetical protein [Desulfobacterales bacterium]
MRVVLHIESLVLDGVPLAPGQRAALQAAVVEALTQRLGQGPTGGRPRGQWWSRRGPRGADPDRRRAPRRARARGADRGLDPCRAGRWAVTALPHVNGGRGLDRPDDETRAGG